MAITFQGQPQLALRFVQRAARSFAGAYLVGGTVRDLLLQRPCVDWDIAVSGDAPRLARQFANRENGFYAYLHDKASRVVFKEDGQEISFDIAPLHGDTLEADLRLRDFTINAIALPLSAATEAIQNGEPCAPVDPLGGVDDLHAHRLRAVDDATFQRDPLRMLRAIRFAMRYQLTIEPNTQQMLIRDASRLPQAAPARIHDELYAILRPEGAVKWLHTLDQYGLFTTLFPEFVPARGMPQPELHSWDVFEHSIEAVGALERLSATLKQPTETLLNSPLDLSGQGDLAALQALLYEAEQQNIFKLAALDTATMKMAALLHDIGKPVTYNVDEDGAIHFYHHPQAGVPIAQEIMQRLHASTQDRRLVQQVVGHHMRPGQLSNTKITPRAVRRYFIDLGNVGIPVALVALADHLAMRGTAPLTEAWARHLATVRLLLTRYLRERDSILPPLIIQPAELIRRLNLTPGPIIGQLLDQIAEAQAEGQIHSKDDALWLAEEFLRDQIR